MIKFLKRHWNAVDTEFERDELCERVARLSEANDNLWGHTRGLRLKNDALTRQVSDMQKSLETAQETEAQLRNERSQLYESNSKYCNLNEKLNSQVAELQKSLETAEQAEAQLLYFKEQLEKERTRLRNENEALCRKIEELLRDHKTISELRRDWETALEIRAKELIQASKEQPQAPEQRRRGTYLGYAALNKPTGISRA